MNKIFAYTNFREYLKDYYEYHKDSTSYFSFRYFSKKAGFASPSWLKFIINGERNLTEDGIERFIGALGMQKDEADYFRALVKFNQAKTELEKNEHFKALMALSAGPEFKFIDKAQYEYYSKWYYSAIRELVTLPGFQEDSTWIASRLRPAIEPSQARKALKLLKRLGFLRYNDENKLVQADPAITTGDEVNSLSIRNFHRQMIGLAQESIERFPRDLRQISSLTMGISEACFQHLKARLVEFEHEIMEIVSKSNDSSDRLYQLNFQFFPLSDTNTTEPKKEPEK